MKLAPTQPISYDHSLEILSPVTGQGMPISEISNFTLLQGAWGVGMAVQTLQQRVYSIPGWSLIRFSSDRKDWVLVRKFDEGLLQMRIKVWSHQKNLPYAYQATDKTGLFTLAAQLLQRPDFAPKLSFTLALANHPSQQAQESAKQGEIYYLPNYAKLSAQSSLLMTLYKNPVFPEPNKK